MGSELPETPGYLWETTPEGLHLASSRPDSSTRVPLSIVLPPLRPLLDLWPAEKQ